jgi:uncharacterized OB-fold protein
VTETGARCPRCGATLRAGQDWCLECGAAARTRLVRARAWRAPVIAALVAVALAGAAAAFAFVRVANTDQDVRTVQAAPATTAPAPSPFTTTTAP